MTLIQVAVTDSIFNYGGLALACLIIFCSTGLIFAFFVPAGAVLFSAGVLVATQSIPYPIVPVLLLLIISSIAGSWMGYLFGVYMGKALYKKKNTWYFNRAHLESAEKLYIKYGEWATCISYFLPIARSFSPVISGISRLQPARFGLGAIIGSAGWVIMFVGAGYLIGVYPEAKPFLPYLVVSFVCLVTLPVLYKLFRAIRMR